jgi:endo-1,4-beta-D-glucanase Y
MLIHLHTLPQARVLGASLLWLLCQTACARPEQADPAGSGSVQMPVGTTGPVPPTLGAGSNGAGSHGPTPVPLTPPSSGAGGVTAQPLPTPGGTGGPSTGSTSSSGGAAASNGGGPAVPTATGSGGAGGAAPDVVLTRGPTPAANGANFPFPQNRQLPNCVYPANYDNDHVVAAFEKWKTDTVTADGASGHLRVKRPMEPGLEPNSTVSEGIAYGMLIAVYMNDQNLFDELWKYEQLWLGENGLMHWYINAAGTEVLGSGAASDADIDMAWALIMADRQWGGGGTLGDSYINVARGLIDRIWQHEIMDGKLLLPGDGWGDWSSVNVSYFMPNYFRTYADVTGNAGWLDVVTTSYDILEKSLNDTNGNTTNGLVPAWCTSEGEPNAGVWEGQTAPTHYQYDSCRTPFRIGLDYCFHGEPRALAYVQKTTGFFSGIGVPNIVDGYDLNGSARPQESGGQSAAFIGPAGVGAMHAASAQSFLDASYTAVAGLDLLVGGHYYEESWTVLSLLMMTGNFLDYTRIEPAQ